VNSRTGTLNRVTMRTVMMGVLVPLLSLCAYAQANPTERSFPQSKVAIEKVLKTMQANLSGRLPVLEGFAKPGEHPLDRYERGYYQATIQVTQTSSGGSLVRVSAKLTAWYTDPAAGRSGYQLLSSNGRLEADLLDQLAEQLAGTKGGNNPELASPSKPSSIPAGAGGENASPARKFPEVGGTFSSSLSQSLAARERGIEHTTAQPSASPANGALQAEADNLAEVLKNQGHPKNLVAVKKSGTPVVGTASLTAKPLFLASMHDEFEMLDFNKDWVHVRISGLSRGWIWRNSVEMPDGIADTDTPVVSALAPAADMFHVSREETGSFPGDWGPLRGKNVRILSVQKIDDSARDAGPVQRLEFAKFLLEKSYKEMSQKPQDATAGVVLIFDSADGGMIAAPLTALQQWKAGTLSDAAFWHKCFFDPPETFDSSTP
jgi:hypothetical protein